ncbi:zona pellucida sperm-binding protein 3 [Brachyhypopomus gauderio]|uniref:zona pellucida sperm-binding protein 3 n=1 Tax=Brachyhypopomus gauderio TaxID=698409 RepID=UPI0040417211
MEAWVSGDKVMYTNKLTYELGPGLPPVVESVECLYNLSGKRTTLEMSKNFVFSMELMNHDFSGPAPSTVFPLGSRISIRAEVEQQGPGTLQVYLQRCVLATSPDLSHSSQWHTVISEDGCLAESKKGNSTFLPRRKPSEIRLYFQAFKFALGENLFFHCDMAAWDLQTFSADMKACLYSKEKNGWELLDDPSLSHICSCCDSSCPQRTRFQSGTFAEKVLGPFVMVEDSQHSTLDEPPFGANGLYGKGMFGKRTEYPDISSSNSGVPVWVWVITVPLVLLILSGAFATGYYLCFWRGGRLGYRPSRDLLTKY